MKSRIFFNTSLNRNTGKTSLSPIYDKIINSDRFHINPKIFVALSNKISDNNLPGKRFAFKSALRKMKL